MQRSVSRILLGTFLASVVGLVALPGCGGGTMQTGDAPQQHEATVGGHGAVSGAAGPDAPAGAR